MKIRKTALTDEELRTLKVINANRDNERLISNIVISHVRMHGEFSVEAIILLKGLERNENKT